MLTPGFAPGLGTDARVASGAPDSSEPCFETITQERDFLALEREWDQLWARTHRPQFSHRFAWFRHGWETTGRPRGRRMFIVVMRVNGRAVLIWPLAVHRRLAWQVGAPLGPEFTEYDSVLVEDSPAAADHLRAALGFLHRHCPADLVVVPHARAGSAMQAVLSAETLPGTRHTLPSPLVSFAGFASWDAYWNARSKNTRGNTGRRSRRFAELGTVTYELIEDRAEFEALLAWTLAHKVEWMARMRLDNDFMRTSEFAQFLRVMGTTVTAPETRPGRLVMFALKLGGKTVATKIGTLDALRYEGFIAAQDPDFASYSTGAIAMMECLKWCMARGLEYDFRIGEEPYKLDWATDDRPATTYRLAIRRGGRALLACEAAFLTLRIAKDRLRTSIPAERRRRAKATILNLLGRGKPAQAPERS
ncbi:GNAT family N-acetyltransferase [Novosphingobium sp.]|uniref:GNAT family N-acetyltransferase n=1 Tax=Novosphingobium sp. TaxID=1874826 RepID=UPI003341D788